MHHKLQHLLDKRGIKDVSQLDEYEKQDFERWNKILSTGEITVNKIKEFCLSQIKTIEGRWRDLEGSKEKNERLITQHIVYKTLSDLIDSHGIEKENLERYLESLI